MTDKRFLVKKQVSGDLIFDTKTEEYFEKIIADYPTLVEVCRIFNALDKKNEIMVERVDQQCDLIKHLKRELKEHGSK